MQNMVRKYHAKVPIKHKVDKDSAKANYKNGILELNSIYWSQKSQKAKQWRSNKPPFFMVIKKMNETELKIEEIPQQHVGAGRAIIDPKIIEDAKWNTGQILELTYNKKTHVKLWPGSPEDYGSGIIKIDGLTRQNIGAGIGDKIKIKTS